MIFLIIGAFIVGAICYHFYNQQKTFKPYTSVLQSQLDSVALMRKQAKLDRLEFWYDELLSTAYDRKENDDEIMAKEAFFLAKTIFPHRIEPRINLVRTFSSLCYDKGFFCYDARKEINYVYRYVDSTDVQMVHEIDSLYALVKDIEFEEGVEFLQ